MCSGRFSILKLLAGIFLLSMSRHSSAYAQDVYVRWDRTLGGSSEETFEYYKMPLRAWSGGYLVAGSSNSPVSGDKTEPAWSSYSDYWAVGLDLNGNKVFDKRLGGSHKEILTDLLVLPGGNLLWIGFSFSMLAGGDKSAPNYTMPSSSTPVPDAWIVKTNPSGGVIWDKHFGSKWKDHAWEAWLAGDTILIVGETDALTAGFEMPNDQRGLGDSWAMALDTNGNVLWTNRFGSADVDGMNAVISDGSGGFYIAGNADGPASFEVTDTSWGRYDFLLYRFDASGNILWDERYGSNGIWENIQDMELLPGGDVLLVGESKGDSLGDKSQPSRGGLDYWILRVDPTGAVVWDRTFGGTGEDDAIDALVTCDGNIVVVGSSDSPPSGERSAPNRGGTDYWIIKLDPDGNLLWDIAAGGSLEDIGGGIQEGADNSYMITGMSNSPASGDKSQDSRGGFDYWVLNIGLRTGFSSPDTVCVGEIVSFLDSSSFNLISSEWDFGDPTSGAANQSTLENPTHVFNAPGDYTIQLIGVDGCLRDTATKVIHVLPDAVANITVVDTILCHGEVIPVGIPGTPGVSYLWTPSDFLSDPTVAQPLFTADSSGTWVLTATNGRCAMSDTMQVMVIPDLVGLDTAMCAGDTMMIGQAGIPPVTISWSPVAGLGDPFNGLTAAFPSTSTTYLLSVSGDACIQTGIYQVDVYDPPVPVFTFDPASPEATQHIHFSNGSTSSVSYQWSMGDGNLFGSKDVGHAYATDGTYLVVLTASNEGCSRSTSQEVVVYTTSRIFIPTAFTPNGDGINDLLVIKGLNTEGFRFELYDRFGKLIFEQTDLSQSWDGKLEGRPAPEGQYSYLLLIPDQGGGIHESSGYVLLLR